MTVRIGITGAGGLGTHLGHGFEDVADATVAAVADVDGDNRTTAGEALDVPPRHRYTHHERMLDGADLDGVAIATPHTLHYDQVVAALDRGIDTLCEKPLCTDLDHARDLVARSEQGEAVLMVGYQRHLHPAFRTIRRELDDRVGDLNYVTAEITQDWIANQQGAWRSDPDLSGGGQLYDTGSHLLDAVLWSLDLEPDAVNARMQFHDADERVDVQAALNVEFAGGAVASITVSGDAARHREHLHAWGETGGLYVDRAEWGRPDVRFVEEDGDVTSRHVGGLERRSKSEVFAGLVRDGGTPPATARDAFVVTAVTEAAYESARTGRTVEIDL
jgi:predicted dehydrogenase